MSDGGTDSGTGKGMAVKKNFYTPSSKNRRRLAERVREICGGAVATPKAVTVRRLHTICAADAGHTMTVLRA